MLDQGYRYVMKDFEKLGLLYLGKRVDPANGKLTDDLVLYESKDLTTHAVCVGMTGSGKTGLGIVLLEEAALDHIPSIIIDPKGDLSNLLLTFPHLSAAEFKPWVDASEGEAKGLTQEKYAEEVAKTWKDGLAAWGEDAERIVKLREAADIVVYTPASQAGIPISILSSFNAPTKEQMLDITAIREKIQSLSSSLLGLLGIEADPIKSREHILLSTLFQNAWQAGVNLDIASLIQQVQKPPFTKIGALDIDTFYPPKERIDLSISLNNLLASPGFQAWMEGVPLDIGQMLYGEKGKPKLSIISIAHLSDSERMFFVTLLLNEVLSWMRRQSGTSSLRALLYMDEIFGFFPPTATPPSKLPMLTLLKQARAFGLGVVLATQNPVDLDYKGLANCGTWFIGKLQTDRDKARLVEGLKSAIQGEVNEKMLDKMFALTGKRTFIMRSVHEKDPVLFQTRWTLSYLRGPLTLTQIASLKSTFNVPVTEQVTASTAKRETSTETVKPNIPPNIPEFFLDSPTAKKPFHYDPQVVGFAKLHFVDVKYKIDSWQEVNIALPADSEGNNIPWEEGTSIPDLKSRLKTMATPGSSFGELPAAFMQEKNYASFAKDFATALYQNQTLLIYQSSEPNMISKPGEPEGVFRARVVHERHVNRDEMIKKLKYKYASKIAGLNEKIQKCQVKVGEKQQKAWIQKIQTAISFVTTVLGAVFGRKLTKGTINDAGTTLRRVGQIGKDSQGVTQAEADAKAYRQQLDELEEQMNSEIVAAKSSDDITVETITLRPRKSDIAVEKVGLVWFATG